MTLKMVDNITVLPLHPNDFRHDNYYIVHVSPTGKVEYVAYDRDSTCTYWSDYASRARPFRLEEAKEYLRSSEFTQESEFVRNDGSLRKAAPIMLLVRLGDEEEGEEDTVRDMKNIRIVRFLGMAAEVVS